MDNIIAIDPSGTGTTGIYYKNSKEEQFLECKEKDWKKQYDFIKELVQQKNIELVIYENTNYIHKKTKDGLNLFRLLGALECLEIEKVKSVNVLKVKEMTKKLLRGIYKIEGLEYKIGRGKGWMYKNKRVSIHQLEAYIIYYLWTNSL